MKRPLQLSLAIALALGGTNALALGLGPVHVKSKLNQPLDAEIPVIQGTAGEAEGLLVSLAAAEDFERVGISRSHLNVPLDFSVGKGANGEVVIRVTSKQPVQDSYLDFLVEANWPKGRLLREYTVLLDPPVTAPARSAPAAVAASPAPPVSKPVAPRREPEKVVATEKPATPAPVREKPAPAPAPAPVESRKVVEGEYGPVKEGETLSGIARAARPDGAGVNLDQMMLALLKNNPNAFYKDNINALKRGAILRIPSADEAKAIGSASEAAAQVRSQFEDWRGGRATPTRVASTTEAPTVAAPNEPKETKPAKTSTAGAEAKSPGERLELVPPKSGKGSLAMADQPGTGNGSAAAAEAKRELARTKEALTAREQEAGELKSRVKELEDLKGKNDRLISLKDSEIADLQQKLKDLQAKADAAAKAAGKPAAPAATTPPPVATAATSPASMTPAPSAAKDTAIDKKDIWGDAGKATAPAGETAKAAPPAVAAPTATTPAPGSTTASTTPAATPPASGTGVPTTGPATPAPTAPGAPSPTTAATTPTPEATTAAPSGSSTSTGATVTPLPATPPTKATAGTTTKATPATTVKKPTPAPQPQEAWYDAPWVKPAALGAGVLLVLLGLFGMRKRKAAPAAAGGARPSIADAFGESPVGGGATSDVMEAEAAALREQIAREPGNVGLYLELLSLYYAERDVPKFEDTAAQMHAYVTDPNQPEWQEAQAMGQELAPHNPLFASAEAYDAGAAFADTAERPALDADDDFGFEHAHVPATPQAAMGTSAHDDEYGFGLAEPAAPAHAAPPPAAADAFTFDDLPPLEAPVARATPAPAIPAAKEPAPAMKEASLDDDFFAGEDAVGTKLDLAKAYMDMGDPDGARSMLEEVVAEGNDVQKAEAHRLISELR
ncbi:FimV/HubP family polar landmark protein [Dokdonella sp.]|uniref:FimV/HubP family polar landmark protein n=1 Tax=Dokdonella sp. TaxID=2291710 RepID=UPI002F416BD9